MGKVSMDTEITEAIEAFRKRAPRRDIKAVDVAALPCVNVSVAGQKAAEQCPKTLYIRELETGLYELRRQLNTSNYERPLLVNLINQLLKKGR